MLFEYDFTVTTAHTVTNKLRTRVKLTHGVIHYFGLFFPPGCQHVVRCRVVRGTHSVFPSNPDGYIKGDGIEVGGDVFTTMFTAPYELDIFGWNDSAAHDHTITARFWIKRLWQLVPFSDQMLAMTIREDTSMIA